MLSRDTRSKSHALLKESHRRASNRPYRLANQTINGRRRHLHLLFILLFPLRCSKMALQPSRFVYRARRRHPLKKCTLKTSSCNLLTPHDCFIRVPLAPPGCRGGGGGIPPTPLIQDSVCGSIPLVSTARRIHKFEEPWRSIKK